MPEFVDKKFKNSEDMCKDMLNKAGVAALPGSDFGLSEKKIYARISFTDFNGDEFMKNIPKDLKIDENLLNKLAPKIVEGTKRLKAWVESA